MYWYIYNSLTGSVSGAQFGAAADIAVPGDYDGDGKFDIAVQRGNGTSAAAFYILGSTIGFYGTQFGLGTDTVVSGDYDGDNKTDLTAVRKSNGTLNWYILKSSNNQLLAYSFGATETDSPVQNDYDGDGKTDVAVWRETDGTFYVLNSNGGSVSAIPWGFTSDAPIAAYDTH